MEIKIIGCSDHLWSQTLQQLPHDIYHLPEYVYLESQQNQSTPEAILIVDNDKIFFLPYLLRRCDDLFDEDWLVPETFDVVSPYGYPGFLLNEAAANTPEFLSLAIDELVQAWRERQICSAFLRLHPLLNQNIPQNTNHDFQITGETISVNLKLDVEAIWHQTRSSHRTKINRCKRAGFTAEIVPFRQYLDEFNDIYEETMNRVNAAKSYYFGETYLTKLADLLENKIHLCVVKLNDEIACAGLFTECCGIVQYHLGGTKTRFLKQAPSKLMFDYVRFWAKECGNEVFHLGGGVGGGKDSLYHFKAGFSKQRNGFLTLRLITDEEKYSDLVELRAKSLKIKPEVLLGSNYFPAYRSVTSS
ncbi:MAG: GNAT family N-acetyltransferase [Waterburya sp.]